MITPGSAGDHEVDDGKKSLLQLEDDAFAHSTHGLHSPPFEIRHPRIEGIQ
jgi:hypothetical protein